LNQNINKVGLAVKKYLGNLFSMNKNTEELKQNDKSVRQLYINN